MPRSIAVIGARGAANYGGFETFVAGLVPRLMERGFQVFYSHRWIPEDARKRDDSGAGAIYFPFRFPRNLVLSQLFELLYDSYFLLKCSFALRCDFVYCLGTPSGLALPLGRLSRSKIIVNIDGLEWKRAKYGRARRGFIRFLFYSCCLFADRLVVDNRKLTGFVPWKYQRKATFIPYGVLIPDCLPWRSDVVAEHAPSGVEMPESGGYWLVVSRLEPDNNIHTIVNGYSQSKTSRMLLVVGSFASPRYEQVVKALVSALPREKKVVFLGSIFDQIRLTMLRCNAFAYLHGHSVGGTNPSLLEAMSVGNGIIAHDNIFNRDVCGDAAVYFTNAQDLALRMDALENEKGVPGQLGEKARAAVKESYSWERVADAYAGLMART